MSTSNFWRLLKSIGWVLAGAFVGACTAPSEALRQDASLNAARAALAPSGTLRAAINFGNPILANRNRTTGEPYGVSVDLAMELGKRLGVPVKLVFFESAGKVVDGIKTGAWDVAFYAIDPVRAEDTSFTPAYVVIEGSYLVPNNSPIKSIDQVDREGVRVMVGLGSAYDLFLSRELQHAKLVKASTSPLVVDMMVSEKVEVAAGVKQQLEADAKRVPGVRLLDGRFMVINQAMAMPKGRDANGVQYLSAFVQEMKNSGFIARALQRHGIDGATVALP